MERRNFIGILSVYFLILNFSFLSAEIRIFQIGSNDLEAAQNEVLNISFSIECKNEECENLTVGLKIPNLETKMHNFSSNNEPDCFSGTCFSRPEGNGPLQTSTGNSSWGCGKCMGNAIFVGEEMRDLVKIGCMSGMKFITGLPLCIETSNGERWDIIFSSWPVMGTGDFVYNRSIERGILEKTNKYPFYLLDEKNQRKISLNQDESKTVSFQLNVTGMVGERYYLVFLPILKNLLH